MNVFKNFIRLLFGLPDGEPVPDIAVYSTFGALIFIAFMFAFLG